MDIDWVYQMTNFPDEHDCYHLNYLRSQEHIEGRRDENPSITINKWHDFDVFIIER